MPYSSHTGAFATCARDRSTEHTHGIETLHTASIEAAFDRDTRQAAFFAALDRVDEAKAAETLFTTRAAHLAATFRPTSLTVRVSTSPVTATIPLPFCANFVTVAKAVDEAVKEVGRAAEAQARKVFATQLADHLAGIGS